MLVHLASWNLFGKVPPQDLCLKKWLVRDGGTHQDPPALYAIGFQELIWSESFCPQSNVELDSVLMSQTLSTWKKCIEAALNSSFPKVEYYEIKSVQLDGILLLLMARKDTLTDDVKIMSTSPYKSFTSNETGHKGAVAISLEFLGDSYCFVTCHLTPHTERWEHRNQDVREICSSMDFGIEGGSSARRVMDHDHVFIFGDLNYRIIPEKLSHDDVKAKLDSCDLKSVLEHDQLKVELAEGGVFEQFEEGEITFRPTYKYNHGTDEWDSSKKQRTPAWCDRVLYSTNHANKAKNYCEQLDYLSHPEYSLSDHKPISCVFKVLNK